VTGLLGAMTVSAGTACSTSERVLKCERFPLSLSQQYMTLVHVHQLHVKLFLVFELLLSLPRRVGFLAGMVMF